VLAFLIFPVILPILEQNRYNSCQISAKVKVRRLRRIAIEKFKIIHKESPIYLHDLVNIKKT
jgi:hypothetical protein